MNFKFYLIGDKPLKFYISAIEEYQKRLTRYCKTSLVHLKSSEQLSKHLSSKSYIINITPSGNHITSEELANKLNTLGISGTSDITILIGYSHSTPNEEIALSTMEMSTDLCTTVTFEQIYRAYRILNNQPYHK